MATRSVGEFESTGVALANPWLAPRRVKVFRCPQLRAPTTVECSQTSANIRRRAAMRDGGSVAHFSGAVSSSAERQYRMLSQNDRVGVIQ